ncbi:glutathione hydrolase 5 proenzyme isoform X1 [Anolis carolinensis]|uniref:Glutathione hydrolase n=1 Tax=Anolis carolinensis TaxID=28377 RepID=H9G7K6_ANOCA|nr:PREDICTED: gamma-glutamyltransferase 5 [Anolis carolinensis]|eukprot:XP_003229527.3 PREDICTED: gamma-glutamyltransferase 5 [Anolis carolinensis]
MPLPGRRLAPFFCLGFLVLSVALGVLLTVLLTRRDGPHHCLPPRYASAAVAADTRTCSQVGRDLLRAGGSAVDGAIGSLVCTSVLNPQSMGLGGGVIFTIYDAQKGDVKVINARERAPQNFPQNLLNQCHDGLLPGPQWVAVPGELRGYQEAHRRYGKLPWKALFEPTIQILRSGTRISSVLNRFLNHTALHSALERSSLRKLFVDERGNFLGSGDLLRWPSLIRTLQAVAENGADEFYLGETAKKMVQDVQKEGGNLTLEDLRNYNVSVRDAIKSELKEYSIYSAPRPAAGPILFFILNILKEFNFTKDTKKAEAYHYIAEALKFANGQKVKLDDPDFSNITEDVLEELISDRFAHEVRKRIDARGDHPLAHYAKANLPRSGPFGTSHVAAVDQEGNAASATSTINHPFGSMVYSAQTGIILNNEMADFCMKQSQRKISPGEMPPSSMVPSVLLSKGREAVLTIGGSGGTLIIPAVVQAIANTLWLGEELDAAIEAPILYADTKNNAIRVESTFDQGTLSLLGAKGHNVSVRPLMLNVVQGISRDGPCLFPYSDRRKNGEASGY